MLINLMEEARTMEENHQQGVGSRKRCFYSMQNLIVISIEAKLETECRGRKFKKLKQDRDSIEEKLLFQ